MEKSAMFSLSPNPSLISTPSFVRLKNEHKCPVCKSYLKDPHQTECGHRICRSCVEELIDTHGDPCRCPVNDEYCEDISLINKSLFNDVSVKREMAKELVYCPYSEYGCQAQVQWRDLNEHIDDCSAIVTCQKCNTIVGKSKIHEHQKLECPEGMISCENSCGESFRRKDWDTHAQNCSKKSLHCTYRNVGCEFSGEKHAIKEHEENVHEHLQLVQIATIKNQLQIEELGKNLSGTQQDLDKFKTEVEQIEEDNKILNQIMKKQTKEMQDLQKHTANNGVKILKLNQERVSKEDMDRLRASCSAIQESQQQLIQNRSQFGTGSGGATQNSIRQHDQQLVVHDVRMAEMDLRFQRLETTNYDGVLIWKIRDFTKRKQDAENGRTLSLYSQPFYTSRYGYKVCGRIYLNGDGSGRGTHMSLFFVVMKGEYDALLKWPFENKVTLMLLDQEGGIRHLSDTFRPDPSSSSFRCPVAEMNVASGCPKFVAHSGIDNKYCKDDIIFIKIIVEKKPVHEIMIQHPITVTQERGGGTRDSTRNSSPLDSRTRDELRLRLLPRLNHNTGKDSCLVEIRNYNAMKNTSHENGRGYLLEDEARTYNGIQFRLSVRIGPNHVTFQVESTGNIQVKLCRHNGEGEKIDITGGAEIPITIFDIYVKENLILLEYSET